MEDEEHTLVVQFGTDGIYYNVDVINLNDVLDVSADREARIAVPGRYIVWKDSDGRVFLKILNTK